MENEKRIGTERKETKNKSRQSLKLQIGSLQRSIELSNIWQN